jgi:hypothetical protein
MTRTRYRVYETSPPYFFTCTCVGWLPIFSQPDAVKIYRARHKSDREHQFWQEGSHPQMIQSDEMMWQKLEYIHNNPVRRGYVVDPLHWRYSSARNYARMQGLVDVTTDW